MGVWESRVLESGVTRHIGTYPAFGASQIL